MVADLTRSRREPRLENALLRQQLIVVRRQFKPPKLTGSDRLCLVLCRFGKHWRDAMLLVKPDTVLRWYRRGFRLF